MNLFSFIDKYGDKTFEEFSFNEIDNIIFSMLSYIDFREIVSSNFFNPKKISIVGKEFFDNYDSKIRRVRAIKNAIKILENIKDTKRYKDLLLYNYVYKSGNDNQFGALTIELNKKQVYVSFEGTDHLIGGWKEDFMLSYMYPVKSQKLATKYLNRFIFSNKKLIVGGHSKGGNLALVASMETNFIVKSKILSIYNNDGPGLLTPQYEAKSFKSIESRLISIVPNYSIVGILMRHSELIVVRSFRKSALSHDPLSWVVNDSSFERVELSSFSEALDSNIDSWLKGYTIVERRNLVEALFNIFEVLNIDSLIDLLDDKKLIIMILKEAGKFDDTTKDMIRSLIKVILKCFTDVTKDEIRVIFNKNKE